MDDEERRMLEKNLSTHSIETAPSSQNKHGVALKQASTEATFERLVNQWRDENHGVSSTHQLSMHPAYQEIISMGEEVVPLLLKELEKKSGQWFGALKSITKVDPVSPEHKGNTKEMTKAWLEWGKQRALN
ncbi:hypothetical protein DSM106972_011070 [Dulcicalothrix desertica PCC 7102]|uniref:Uncharacterized protein n=2 Tax=Dulcicalothrix desertica TaxID=32056 RepID=A0A3S1DFP0_9CYAN|nr:hypothetical protein [Dulcicalothrix desertica]RUT09054.1 hypothetical protein DSM106972_011070 [Dulcicalothrix desertica PCC 7102]